MHQLVEIKQKIGNTFYRIKKNLDIFPRLKKNILLKNKYLEKDFREFLEKGYIIQTEFLDRKDLKYIIGEYLNLKNINNNEYYDYNLSIPFFDKKIIEKITSSSLFFVLKKFYSMTCNSEIFFQQTPLIVITKSSVDQSLANDNTRIPVRFHTDYPSEISLQIPLINQLDYSPHTLYLEKTNRDIKFKCSTIYDEKKLNDYNKVKLLGNEGDAVLIDTQGVHRANIFKNSLRIMLFFKFSSKKNILSNIDYKELYKRSAKLNYFKYDNKSKFLEDYNFAISSNFLMKNQINIYKDFQLI